MAREMQHNLERGTMTNPFVHVELNTPDPEKAKAFYAKLFSWQLEDMPNTAVPDGNYTMIKAGNGTGGGIMKHVPGGPVGWLAYACHGCPLRRYDLSAKS
jgi:predicted enzyme related to lactoylglutathione lyase